MINDKWFILGYIDVEDRPNIEIIYQGDNSKDTLNVYNKIVESFEEYAPQELKDELMNEFGIVNIWKFNNNFHLLSIFKAQKWNLED